MYVRASWPMRATWLPFLLLPFASCGDTDQGSTHYEVLGLDNNATDRDIKRSYRRKALLEHPDKSDKADAEERFRRVATAFEVLGEPNRRADYDARLANGGSGFEDSTGGFSSDVDPHQMFKDHVGDIYQHWSPGYRVEGDVLRNGMRIKITLYPDGSSEVHDSEDTMLHRFLSVGAGWCVFPTKPKKMQATDITETECRQKCVLMLPHCEGYAYQKIGHACHLYKRDAEPQKPARSDGTRGVVCYQQDENAFDSTSKILQSVVSVVKANGEQSTIQTDMFCHDPARARRGVKPRETKPWLDSMIDVAGMLTDVTGIASVLTSSGESWKDSFHSIVDMLAGSDIRNEVSLA